MAVARFYKLLVGGLVLLNLTLLGLLFLGRPPVPPPMGGPHNGNFLAKAIEMMELDDGQNKLFIESASAHNHQMNIYDSLQISLLPAYFEKLYKPDTGTDSQEILDQISEIERKKVTFTFQHLEDIKGILNPEQQKHYKNFVDQATNRIYNNRNQTLHKSR